MADPTPLRDRPQERNTPKDVEAEQTRHFANATGSGVPQNVISDMQIYAQDAQAHESYRTYSEIPFIYEIMIKPDWNKAVKEFGRTWVAHESNLERAAKQVGRPVPSFAEVQERLAGEGKPLEDIPDPTDRSYLLRGFCIFRLKAKNQEEDWEPHRGFLGCDASQPQTVVFIALQDLDSRNGFFMNLKEGNDVCLDSRPDIQVPRSGGGLGIYLALNL
ncbi:hypothetical protein LTR09_012745 [Extremus antarcticus]|uniref:Uncharacterized protein n=1 Tax=Extremus antarcticus TaxID=702011 RepID=A0AAJ0D9S7_9PEZI|nr:hypothetical protein LTR09_012745 [Extremus antarcticus]